MSNNNHQPLSRLIRNIIIIIAILISLGLFFSAVQIVINSFPIMVVGLIINNDSIQNEQT